MISGEKAQNRAGQTVERAQHEPLGQPAVPGGPAGGKGFRHDPLDGVGRAGVDHGQARSPDSPRHRPQQLRAQIGERPDDGPAGDGDDEERHHQAHRGFVDRQPEQVERQVLAEHRVAGARGRRTEEARQRQPQAGGAGRDQGGDDHAGDQRRAGRQARQAPGGEAPIDRHERAANDQDRSKDRALQLEREPEPVQLAKLGEPVELQRQAHGRLEGEDRQAGERDIGQVPVDAMGERRRRRVAAMPEHRGRERDRCGEQQDQVGQAEHSVAPGTQGPAAPRDVPGHSAWRA